MKFYIYYDAYGRAIKMIGEKELAEKYANDPENYLKAASTSYAGTQTQARGGHVGTVSFDSEEEAVAFLRSLGEEIEGFYTCSFDSRPYNF
jgi:hypothetical protein